MKFHSHPMQVHREEMFQIPLDTSLYRRVVDDMLEHAGGFLPRAGWLTIKDAATEEEYLREKLDLEETKRVCDENLKRFAVLSNMLSPWVGSGGRQTEDNQEIISQARVLLKTLGQEALLDDLLQSPYVMRTDIRTVCELAFIQNLSLPDDRIQILEIGGGYGRLCEAILNRICGQTLYIMADSVPLSLVYAWLFLKENCPNKRIGFYLDDPDPDLSIYDCYIVPTWFLPRLLEQKTLQFDIAINIQSMQEMSQWHIKAYFNIFENAVRQGGYIYLDNNKRYLFQGEWNYPDCWKLLLRYNTPFSWSSDCPMEIFQKTGVSQIEWNKLLSYGQVYAAIERDQCERVRQQCDSLSNEQSRLQAQLEISQQETVALQSQLEACRNETAALQSQLEVSQQEIVALQSQLEVSQQEIVALQSQLEVSQREVVALRSKLKASQQETAALQSQLEVSRQETAAMQSQLKVSWQETTILQAQLEVSRNETAQMQKWVYSIFQSRSWRWTKPLRVITNFFKRLRMNR